MCAQKLMHVVAHGDVWTHERESALKVVSGRKIPCRTEESNLCQLSASLTLYQLSYVSTPEPSIYLPVCLSIYLPVCLSVCLLTHPSIHLVYLSIHLFLLTTLYKCQ